LSVALGRSGRYAVIAVITMLAAATPALAGSAHQAASGGAGIPGFPNSQVGSGKAGSGQLGSRRLHEGMRGHDVRVLQAYLTVAGFGTVVDGSFGPQTKQNVIAFQRSKGVTANGVVSLGLARVLQGLVAQIQALPPTGTTRINADGTATAPAGAPAAVVAVVAAANQIINTSYCYAGGHGAWKSSCYDCSGSVSYALHGGGLLSTPEDSTQFETYGDPGPGRYITIYADPSHAFLVVAGRAFNTATYGGPNIPAGTGPRWRYHPLGNLADGGHYVVRHPPGL
jgi:peptidoglycan hydrolase-like protein with peptidoglycan-binding domain